MEARQHVLRSLLTVADGGLSLRDVAELTGWTEREVEEQLRAGAGRSVSRVPGRWRPETDVYVLGNGARDADQPTAVDDGLAEQCQRLHAWADRYRRRGWPAGMPEYLVEGYFRLLCTSHDVDRMVAWATDAGRHDRLLEIVGSDRVALAEIDAAQEALAGQDEPDLAAMARLAVHRGYLTDRYGDIPTDLPALWARLGQPDRGEDLARMMPDGGADALAELVRAVAETGDLDRAETIARSMPDQETAERFGEVRGVGVRALAAVARVAAETGDLDRAEGIVGTLTGAEDRAYALTSLVPVVARAAPDRARALADQVDAMAGSMASHHQHSALERLAVAVAEAGDPDRVEAIVAMLPGATAQWLVGMLAPIVAEAGDLERAEHLTGSLGDMFVRASALLEIAEAAARAGDADRTRRLATLAVTVARDIPPEYDSAQETWDDSKPGIVLLRLFRMLARVGDLNHAEEITRSMDEHRRPAETATLAEVAYETGYLARAGDLFEHAEALAHALPDAEERSRALAGVVAAKARCTADTGDLQPAVAAAESATDPDLRARRLVDMVHAAAGRGAVAQAELAASRIAVPHVRARALTEVAAAAARAGAVDRARDLARQAQAVAQSVSEPDHPAQAGLAAALGRVGERRPAEFLARSITDQYWRTTALRGLGITAAAGGDPERARSTAGSTANAYQRDEVLADLSRLAARPTGRSGRAAVQPENERRPALGVLADALRSEGWRSCLYNLGSVEPSVVGVVALEYLRLMKPP